MAAAFSPPRARLNLPRASREGLFAFGFLGLQFFDGFRGGQVASGQAGMVDAIPVRAKDRGPPGRPAAGRPAGDAKHPASTQFLELLLLLIVKDRIEFAINVFLQLLREFFLLVGELQTGL